MPILDYQKAEGKNRWWSVIPVIVAPFVGLACGGFFSLAGLGAIMPILAFVALAPIACAYFRPRWRVVTAMELNLFVVIAPYLLQLKDMGVPPTPVLVRDLKLLMVVAVVSLAFAQLAWIKD